MYGLPDSVIYGTYKRVSGAYRPVPEDGYAFWAEFLYVTYNWVRNLFSKRESARTPRERKSRIHLVGRD